MANEPYDPTITVKSDNTTNLDKLYDKYGVPSQFRTTNQSNSKVHLNNAVGMNPDDQVETIRLSDRFNLPLDTVERNRAELKQKELLDSIDLQDSPVLNDFLANERNARLAIDDVDNLKQIETLLTTDDFEPEQGRSVKDFATDTLIDTAVGVVGLGESVIGLSDIVTSNMMGNALQYIGYDPQATRQILGQYYSAARKKSQQEVQQASGFLETTESLLTNPDELFGTVVQSIPMMMGSMAAGKQVAMQILAKAGIAPGTPAATALLSQPANVARITTATAGTEGALAAGSIQEGARQQGREYWDSVLPAVMGGLSTFAIGKFLSRFIPDVEATAVTGKVGKDVVEKTKTIAGGTLREAIEELPQSAQEQMFSNLALGKPASEGVSEAAAAGLLTGAGMGLGASTVSQLRAIQKPLDDTVRQSAGSIVEQQQLDRMIQLFQSSKFRGRAQDRFADFLRANNSPREVFITPDGVKAAIDAGLDVPEGMIGEAASMDADVVMDIATFATEVAANEELMNLLRPHVRLSSETLTINEMEGYDLDLKSILDRAEQDSQFEQEVNAFYDQLVEMLVNTGRMTQEEARLNALVLTEYVAVKAQRENMTFAEVAQMLGLTVEGPATETRTQAQGRTFESVERDQAESKGLDMSQEARMERARAMGFDTDRVLYHYTTADFDQFRLPDEMTFGKFGRGIYLSPSPQYSERYVDTTREGANAIPVFINANIAPLDAINKAQQEVIQEESFKGQRKLWAAIHKKLREQGYNALEMGQEILVFDPSSIRSVNAAFDPEFQGDSRILAQSSQVQTVDDLRSTISQINGVKTISLFESKGDLKLDTIIIDKDKRKSGIGSQVMNLITDYADRNGLRIKLTPAIADDLQGTTSRKRLVNFYKRFGFVENKGRNKDFEISEGMYREPQKTLYQSSPEFKKWAGTNEVIESDEINETDFTGDGPFVMKVYHGTTHSFEVFDALRGNKEGQFGAVNYFTSSDYDAETNYAGEEPDLTNRIEQRAKQLVYDIEEDPESFGVDENADFEEVAKELARQQLSGGQEQVLELYVRTDKPFVIGDNQWVSIREEISDDEIYQQVSDNTGELVETIRENPEDFEDEIDEARWEIESDRESLLSEVIQTVADKYDVDAAEIMANMEDLFYEPEIQSSQLEKFMRDNEVLSYTQDPETGELIQSQIIGEVIQGLGYDSIILKNAEERFSTMDIPIGTAHIHIFDPNKTNIKSVENIGTFDPNDPNIFKQQERGSITFTPNREAVIRLTKSSDRSTFLHESGHLFLEMEARFAELNGVSEDQQTILDWLGVESFDQIKTEHHEKWARGFEAYVMEGKSPSLGLRRAFDAFRDWLLRIYRDITNLDVQLTDDIRGVMDRMLATDQAINEALATPLHEELFRSQEQAGMTDEEWQKYQDTRAKRDSKAKHTLTEKLIDEWTRRRTAEWREEKQPLIEDALEELRKQPVYQILDDMREAPVDYDMLKQAVGVDKLPGKFIGKAKKDGIDPAEYAEAYGYNSVSQMYNAIVDAPSLKQAADEQAEAQMVAKYGDILNDGTIEAEAREAVENEEQAGLLLMELNALKPRTSPTINGKLIQADAKRIIGGMKFKEIKPNKYYRAMLRAAQNAAKATDPDDKFRFKYQQIVNHHMYKEAVAMREQMQKHRKYIRRVQEREYSTKEVNQDYIMKMKLLANLYDLRTNPQKQVSVDQFLSWYQTQLTDEDVFTKTELLDINLIRALEAKKDGRLPDITIPMFEDLTADELRSTYDMLRHLRYVGGQISDIAKAELQARVDETADSIIKHGGTDTKDVAGAPKKYTNLIRAIQHTIATLPSLRNLIRVLDGFKTDVAFRNIYQVVNNANNEKIRLAGELYDRFNNELADIHKVGIRRDDPITYQLESGMAMDFTSEHRFMIALYWGTESSRDAIRDGFGMTDADVMAVLGDLTTQQLELVNNVWKVNESLWPELSKASKKMQGVAPPKLDPAPFTVNGVEMTGGHMRLFYDTADIEAKTEASEALKFTSIVPSKAGSLYARVGSGGRPPLLDRNNITRAFEDNVHYIAFSSAGRELAAILNNPKVQNAIEKKHGRGFKKALIENITNITTNAPTRESHPAIAGLMRLLRNAATFKHLAYSIRNSVQQVSSLPIAAQEVGTINLLNAMARFGGGRDNLVGFINERSSFMKNRASLVNREASEYLRQMEITGKAGYAWQVFRRHGFTMQTVMDSLIAYPTWLAKYEQSMAEYGDETRAATDADNAVAESVGSGADIHMGSIFHQNQSELLKTLTMFGSWFNAYFQRVYRGTEGFTTMTRDGALSLTITPFIAAIMSALLVMDYPDEDDDQTWTAWILSNYTSFLAGMVPILRDFISAFKGFTPKSPLTSFVEIGARSVSEIEALSEGRQSGLKTASDVGKLVTTVVPVPGSGTVFRAVDFVDSNMQGQETGSAFKKTYQALVEGPDRNK